jgi:hypothetical protein
MKSIVIFRKKILKEEIEKKNYPMKSLKIRHYNIEN